MIMNSGVILETQSLHKRFGGVVAADDINFRVEAGELRCMIGPNGAGKSTLFSMLCGIQNPDSGQIFIGGNNVTRWHSFQRVNLGVGLTFQTNRAFRELSVRRNLEIARTPRASNDGELGRQRFEFALQSFGIDPDDETRAGEITHNLLQWLEISMVLANYPDLLLLDEPTAGLSVEETTKTAGVLKHLNSTGMTIVVVEHDMAFVREIAQVVTVLHQGRIYAEGSVTDITANEGVKRIYLGKG